MPFNTKGNLILSINSINERLEKKSARLKLENVKSEKGIEREGERASEEEEVNKM